MKILSMLWIAVFSTGALAQNSARFEITRGVIGGGGATNSSTRFQLVGSAAQPLAAVPSSARFSIQGGFWIQPPPIIFAPTAVNGNFLVSIQTELGGNYTVSYADSLTGSSWQPLTNFTGNGGIVMVTNSASGVSSRYFRLLRQ